MVKFINSSELQFVTNKMRNKNTQSVVLDIAYALAGVIAICH